MQNNLEIAWLPVWSYTHEVYEKIWKPWEYLPNDSIAQLIDNVRAWWISIVPINNTEWWQVNWPIPNIFNPNWHIKWWFELPVEHSLAVSKTENTINDMPLSEIHAHPQALIQCKEGLRNLWADVDSIIKQYNKLDIIPKTTQCVIEINDWIWVLEKITAIFESKRINLRHVHSFPYWEWKFRFYISYDDTGISLLQLNRELERIWWQVIEEQEQNPDSKIKLIPRNANTDGIPDALWNPEIWVICSWKTALNNWLKILDSISPENNTTSFAILANNNTRVSLDNFKWIVQDRVLWLLTLPNKIWILRQALGIISDTWLSLSFILSLSDGEWWCRIATVMNKWVNWEIYKIQKKLNQLNWNLRVM